MNKSVFLIILCFLIFCKSPKKDANQSNSTIKIKNYKNDTIINKNIVFDDVFKANTILGRLKNSKKKELLYALICREIEDTKKIEFYETSLRIPVVGDITFALGIKNDSLYSLSTFPLIKSPLYPLISFKKSINKKFPEEFFYPIELIVDTLYSVKNEKILEVNCRYEYHHSKTPKYTIHKLYISNRKLIFKIDVIDNETGEIYTTDKKREELPNLIE